MRGRLSWNVEGGTLPLWLKLLIVIGFLSVLGWNASEIIDFITGVFRG